MCCLSWLHGITFLLDTPTSSGTNAAPIIGGVVAVVGLLVIAGVVIVLLVLRHHNHRSSLSVEKHSE